jgi:hypothetical protein
LLPAAQDGRVRLVRDEIFVAGEGSMGGLGGDFAYNKAERVKVSRCCSQSRDEA